MSDGVARKVAREEVHAFAAELEGREEHLLRVRGLLPAHAESPIVASPAWIPRPTPRREWECELSFSRSWTPDEEEREEDRGGKRRGRERTRSSWR